MYVINITQENKCISVRRGDVRRVGGRVTGKGWREESGGGVFQCKNILKNETKILVLGDRGEVNELP